ncbi:Zn-dependent exopeptidase [Melanomma pulvis-pyrius CBS 109.77]|uniref:Peptide hydrolase n=1 Tax=Melanomma pulvis-pyrius CBS 109.77 TaxID=1314802 RepID=A0A6A6X6K7_9PLEO|nr:Zn-dependent exopeptidase [Melanomma pulvis-pyrius CBS 109.77]
MLDVMKLAVAIGAFAASATASAVAGAVDLRGGYGYGYGYGHGHGGGGHGNKTCKHKPLVNSKALQASIRAPALLNGSQTLLNFAYSYPDRNRLMGGGGHNATVKYLVSQLEALDGYYTVELQPFSAVVHAGATFSLFIDGANTSAGVFDYTGSGDVTGTLVVVANQGCELTDYPSTLSGNIALIQRGACEFGLKSAYAGASGAKGALIYNNIPGGLDGTLGVPPRPEGDYVPTLGLSQDQGAELVASIAAGTTHNATLIVDAQVENRTTHNVLATSNCGALNTTLMLGAHTDSVAAGPGINDDGSGTIGILEVAKHLAKYRVNNAVRFGFWSGEEEGDLGSNHYVDSLSPAGLADIRAYLNFDMIASPNFIHAIYDGDGSSFNESGPAGSGEIEKFFEEYFVSAGENFTATAFDGRSDYAPFIENGIPAGGTFTGAEQIKTAEEALQFGGTAGEPTDANYHGPGDTVDNLDVGAFVLHAKGIAASVAKYATSFESLPPKGLKKRSVAGGVGRKRRAGKKGRKTAI